MFKKLPKKRRYVGRQRFFNKKNDEMVYHKKQLYHGEIPRLSPNDKEFYFAPDKFSAHGIKLSKPKVNIPDKRNNLVFGKTTLKEWNAWKCFVGSFYSSTRMVRSRDSDIFNGSAGTSANGDVRTESNMLLVHKKHDNRPYVSVKVLGKDVIALLDTGASHSVSGRDGLKMIENFGLEISELEEGRESSINTADGVPQKIIGYVYLPVEIGNKLKLVKILVVPSLSHSLILGSDFCTIFGVRIDYEKDSYFVGEDRATLYNSHKHVGISELNNVKTVQSRSDLTEQQVIELESVRDKFKELSWRAGTKLGRTNATVHKIDTGEAEPVKQRHHNISPYMLEYLNQELDRMLELGVVRPSCSPWASPVLLVKKPNGEKRLCFDGRKLNSLTKKDAYPLPHVNHILSKLTGARYLSSIDLKAAFWQIPLEEGSCEKTAFVIPSRGLFEFVVMPFGLSNAAQTQQRLMDRVLGYSLEPFVFVYLDDIIIATSTFEKHVEVLLEVFGRLKEAHLTINLEKCDFCLPSLRYLGFLLDGEGLRTDPDKVSAMLAYPRPQTTTEVKRFIGMVGWYRRFIPHYSDLTAPMTALIKGKRKSQRISWGEEAEESFRKIKEALVSAPILVSPDFMKQFTLQCDASDVGVGCVLTQNNDQNEEVVIAFASRTLSQAERKYTSTEKELLALLFGVEKFRCYVEGTRFKVITDHYSLCWLNRLKDPLGRLARWAVKLQQYDMIIEHRKGSLNVVPDALSRAPVMEVSVISLNSEECVKDSWYSKMVRNLQDTPDNYPDWMVKDNLLYKHVTVDRHVNLNVPEWKIVIPKNYRKDVLASCHDDPTSAHLGIFKTLSRVKELYYWPKMRTYIKNYVKHCRVCAAQKSSNLSRPGFMGKQKQVSYPWQAVSVDVWGPLPRSSRGFSYLLAVSDYFSKFVLLHPLRQANSKNIIKFLENDVYLMFGSPQVLTCDNATQFTCKEFKSLCNKYGVKIWYNARYHAQVNQVERVNRVIGSAVRSYIEDDNHKDWDIEIPKISYALRTAVHEATGFSPVYLNFGRYVPIDGTYYGRLNTVGDFNLNPFNREQYAEELSKLPLLYKDVHDRLKKAYEKNSQTYNLRKRPSDQYAIGDRVWKKNYVLSSAVHNFAAKLAPKNTLCRVKKVISNLVYELVDDASGKNLGRWHVKDLKPFNDDDEF